MIELGSNVLVNDTCFVPDWRGEKAVVIAVVLPQEGDTYPTMFIAENQDDPLFPRRFVLREDEVTVLDNAA